MSGRVATLLSGVNVNVNAQGGARKRAKQVDHADRDPTPLQGGWQRDNTGRASAHPCHAHLSPAAQMRGESSPVSGVRRDSRAECVLVPLPWSYGCASRNLLLRLSRTWQRVGQAALKTTARLAHKNYMGPMPMIDVS